MNFLLRLSMLLAGVFLLQGVSSGAEAGQPSLESSGSSGSRIPLQEVGRIVTLHNTIREEVGVGPVRWSEKLAGYAQQWADHLVTSQCGMEHRPRSGKWREKYGENLFIGTARYYGTSDAVRAWAAEKTKYHGDALQSSHWAAAGHYTQIVWQDTTEIGCASGLCKDKLIVVCNYDPPGNFLGRKPY